MSRCKFAAAYAALVASTLAGCGAIGSYSHDAFNDNIEADRASNQQILLNILRARERRPLELTSLRQVTVTSTLQGQFGLSAPLREFGGTTALTATPQVTVSRQPQVQDDILDTQEFYNGFLKPIPMQTVDLYLNQGYPPAFFYHLLLRTITVSQGAHSFVASNAIGDPQSDSGSFRQLVEAFLDARLVTEPITEKSNVGPPLKPQEVKERLREIVAADKEKLTLEHDKKKNEYQLQRSEKSYRFCLQSALERAGPGSTQAKDPDLQRLVTLALGLRCGASAKQRDEMVATLDRDSGKEGGAVEREFTLGSRKMIRKACGAAQLDAGFAPDFKEYLTRYCDLDSDLREITGIGSDDDASLALRMTTKSTEAVLYYLGEAARRSISTPAAGVLIPVAPKESAEEQQPLCGKAWGKHETRRYACRPLLVIETGDSATAPFVSTEYEGNKYWIPSTRDKAGLSLQAFEVFHQLFALNKSGKDLPATTILTVTGIP